MKKVKGVLIDPDKKTLAVIEYVTGYYCCETTLGFDEVSHYPLTDSGEHQIVCQFDEDENYGLGTPFGLIFNEQLMRGKCLIVQTGDFENERDYYTIDVSNEMIKLIQENVLWESELEIV